MHLDKGNKLDEILRSKFESHSSEVDPRLWTGIIDEVERGDKTNGLLLTIGSLFIAVALFLGYDQTPVLKGSSVIAELTQEIPTELDFTESSAHVPSERKEVLGAIIPQKSREISSNKDRATAATSVRPIQSAGNSGADSKVILANEGFSVGNKEIEELRDEVGYFLPSVDNVEIDGYAAPDNSSDLKGPISPVRPRSLTRIAVSSQSDERVIHPSSIPGLETMPIRSMPGRWGAEVLVGPSLNYRTFEASESQAFTDHKNESDSRLLSANTEILIHYQPNEQWIFSLGVGRMNTGENYAFTLDEQTHEFKNEYHYLTIPVRVKTRIWDISPGAGLFGGIGAQLGFLEEGISSWVDLATEQAVTHNNKGAESPFRERVISGEADLMIRVALSERIFISAQERGTYTINSVYKNDTGLEQHQFSFDTLFGLGLRF